MAGRPRGFIELWEPKTETQNLIDNVNDIIADNREIGALTLRQIFYMLVSGYGYDKTEKAYKRLCETMNKARRARMTDMADIRDDGLTRYDPHFYDDADQLIRTFKYEAQKFRHDRQEGQDTRIYVWCEAGGMAPQLQRYCDDYGVPVISSGGFDSVTTKHKLAEELSEFEEVEILHIGDHDPSGVHMCKSLDEDLQAFVMEYMGNVFVTRLAVTPEQVEEHGFPQAPPKPTDKRAFTGLTTQAEAIPPRMLREIVTDAITDRQDEEIRLGVIDRERAVREDLIEKLSDL